MNFLTLKEDFYKRYETSGKFLHYTSYGALCTLLGHTDIPTAPSLCCTLSMRVEMFARKTGGKYVKIENTTTDTRTVDVKAVPRPDVVWPVGKVIYLTFADGPGPY